VRESERLGQHVREVKKHRYQTIWAKVCVKKEKKRKKGRLAPK